MCKFSGFISYEFIGLEPRPWTTSIYKIDDFYYLSNISFSVVLRFPSMSLLMQEERVQWRRSVILFLLKFLSFLRVSARISFAHFVMTKNVKSLLSELVLLLASFVLGRPPVAAFSPAGERKGE